MPPPAKVELQEVLGILRLAHKYDVNYLFRRALQHLSTAYPSDLLETLTPTTSIEDTEAYTTAHHSEVIEVSTEVGALWVLPIAYYWMCSPGLSPLLEENERPNHLSTDQLRNCLRSHTPIAAMLHVHQFLRAELPPCEEPQDCPARLRIGNELLLDAVSRGEPMS
ncbi:hypothetical protein DFH06DRAFT_471708 [Mycena polygramma]|nr:hypothetical protein DFH06DRAFT_471708 [Mycena polygramma]